jgi:hypothetical protein
MTTFGIIRSFLLIAAPLAVFAAIDIDPAPAGAADVPAPFQIQLNHELVGVLGQPFQVTAEMFSASMREVECKGEVTDAAGKLLLSGGWDLILDEIKAGKVISHVSLKPAAPEAAVVSRSVSTLKNLRATWTWDAQALFAHVGNYRLHLRYAGSAFDGEQFHMDTTLGPPDWVHLEVLPNKRRALLGEPVEVTFKVTNTGIDTYPMHTGGDYRGASRALSYFFTAVRTDGIKGWDPEPLQQCWGGIGSMGGLAPGKCEHKEVILGAYVRFPGPGTYKIDAYHSMGFGTPVPGVDNGRHALAGSFTIDIAAPTAADCDRIVREGIAADQDYIRWRRLAHLHEPAYLETLRQALLRGGPENIAVDVVEGINSITTTDATTALFACLDDARPQVRQRALDRLAGRMPEVDRSARTMDPAWAGEQHRLHVLFSAQTWDDKQQNALTAKLPALLASTDKEVVNRALDLLGRLGTPDAGETIARFADRLVIKEGISDPDPYALSKLENAAYALGLAHGTPCQVDIHSSPGRLACWAYMLAARREEGLKDATAESDELLLAMLSMPGKPLKTAAFTGLDQDAGARLPIPWKALFQENDFDIWQRALNMAFRAPHATILEVIRSCQRDGWDANKCTWFDDALQRIADHPAP